MFFFTLTKREHTINNFYKNSISAISATQQIKKGYLK